MQCVSLWTCPELHKYVPTACIVGTSFVSLHHALQFQLSLPKLLLAYIVNSEYLEHYSATAFGTN